MPFSVFLYYRCLQWRLGCFCCPVVCRCPSIYNAADQIYYIYSLDNCSRETFLEKDADLSQDVTGFYFFKIIVVSRFETLADEGVASRICTSKTLASKVQVVSHHPAGGFISILIRLFSYWS
ncbi:hypothetical protein AHAS_Ahas19G0064900 [Arachis hypogaea]